MTNSLFAGAFMKRHSDFGTGGPGAIYRVDPTTAPSGAFFTSVPNAANPHDTVNPQIDAASWDLVGKIGLGDIDMFDDDTTLFVMNLFDQRVYQIAITITAGVPSVGATSSFGFPANPCPAAGDFRPFGLGVHDGLVYIGAVCSAEASQAVANLSAHVYVLTPGVGISAAPVLSFPLNYPRGCTIRNNTFPAAPPPPNALPAPAGNCASARWNPWTPVFPTFPAPQPLTGFGDQDPFEFTYPQPILSDIEFDFNGDMILGFRDRFGDQQGFFTPQPSGAGTFSGDVAGDILRACFTGAGWVLESAGTCGALTSGDAASLQGPGGGEFYLAENYPFHDETTQGGLLWVPTNPDVLTTAYDPIFDQAQPFDGGVLWLSNTNGTRTRAYRIFDAPNNPPFNNVFFGKGGSLGDMDAICNAAPIEIGNRVWIDSDADGRQSPNETPLAGVVVELYGPGNVLIATATTDANGNYLFSNGTGATTGSSVYGIGGLTFLTAGFEVRINLGQPALAGYTPTFADTSANGEDNRDSDGITSGTAVLTTFGTGIAGANNHTYDFGFFFGTLPTPTAPAPGGTSGGGTTGGGTGTNPVVVITPNPPFSQPGGTVIWTITVTNPTGNPMPNVSFTKTEPSNVTIIDVNASGGTAIVNGQTITFTIGSLGPNETITIILETLIESDTPLPFIITNTVILGAPYSGRASANVISATLLPATGISPLLLWLMLTAGALSSVALFVRYRRRRQLTT